MVQKIKICAQPYFDCFACEPDANVASLGASSGDLPVGQSQPWRAFVKLIYRDGSVSDIKRLRR